MENHQEQLLNYSFQQGVKLAILTNGITWSFYLPLNEGSWEQRKFYTIDILQQDSEDAKSKFIDFLSKDNIKSGRAIQNAESIYRDKQKINIIEETLPKAWNKIIEEADELLIDLINETAEKICGFKADTELVEQFLSRNKGTLIIPETSTKTISSLRSYQAATSKSQSILTAIKNYTGKSISSFSFHGSNYNVKSWKDLLINLCNFINSAHRNEFDKVLNIVGRKRPYFSLNGTELRAPQKINNSKIYVETNLSANRIVIICFKMLAAFGYKDNELMIEAS